MFDKSLTLPVLLILSIWCFQIPPLAITLLMLLLYKLFACFSRKQNVLCLSGSLGFAGTWQNKGAQMPEQFLSWGKMPSLWMGNEGGLLCWKWCLCPRAIGFKPVLPKVRHAVTQTSPEVSSFRLACVGWSQGLFTSILMCTRYKQSLGATHLCSLTALCVVSVPTCGLRSVHGQTLLWGCASRCGMKKYVK